ncbi:hypothetical protein G9A89_007259 [Geosiphon pyriformis]|nr:hypothetical protein G9A89_007259 [Geosiphon pyriformis]
MSMVNKKSERQFRRIRRKPSKVGLRFSQASNSGFFPTTALLENIEPYINHQVSKRDTSVIPLQSSNSINSVPKIISSLIIPVSTSTATLLPHNWIIKFDVNLYPNNNESSNNNNNNNNNNIIIIIIKINDINSNQKFT